MRPINVSLDATTWELAKAKGNFSGWVRAQLRAEDNKRAEFQQRIVLKCRTGCGNARKKGMAYCRSCQIDLGLDLDGEEE